MPATSHSTAKVNILKRLACWKYRACNSESLANINFETYETSPVFRWDYWKNVPCCRLLWPYWHSFSPTVQPCSFRQQWLCRADWQKGLAYKIDRLYGPLLNIGLPGGAILLPKSVHDAQHSTTAKTPVVLLRWALSFWKGYVNMFLFECFLGPIRPKPFQNICISTITENYGFHLNIVNVSNDSLSSIKIRI